MPGDARLLHSPRASTSAKWRRWAGRAGPRCSSCSLLAVAPTRIQAYPGTAGTAGTAWSRCLPALAGSALGDAHVWTLGVRSEPERSTRPAASDGDSRLTGWHCRPARPARLGLPPPRAPATAPAPALGPACPACRPAAPPRSTLPHPTLPRPARYRGLHGHGPPRPGVKGRAASSRWPRPARRARISDNEGRCM